MNSYINNKLDSLEKSKFRGSFHLNNNMKEYAREKGYLKIKSDAYDLISKRLKVLKANDGKQTPMRANSHPVFIAQHATGTCCRGCLEKIHNIPKTKELTEQEINYIVEVIMTWITREVNRTKK